MQGFVLINTSSLNDYAGLGLLILRRKMHRKCQQKPDLEPIYNVTLPFHFFVFTSHTARCTCTRFFLGVLQGPSRF